MSAMPGMSAKSRSIIAASSTHGRRRSFSREQRSRGADRRGASPSFGTTPPDDDDVFDDDASSFDHRVSCLNVDDYRRRARRVLPRHLYEYLASGSDDERTLRENRAAFARWFLRPRVLRPVGRTSARATLLGRWPVAAPILCSPAGVHALCDADGAGELSTVRACRGAGVLFGLSQHATRTIEDVAAAAADVAGSPPPPPPLFYQAYLLKDRAVTRRLIRRALRAGYVGVFLTVDSVRFGYREADARNGFSSLPPPHRLVNYDEEEEEETAKHAKDDDADDAPAWDQNTERRFELDVSWEDVRWIKREVVGDDVPVVVKGIMTAEDAELAVAAGADAVMVSNHGGRQLDGTLSSIDALPEVVARVNGRVPVWMDGGVRRGTDVLKALALGASAVGVGKPVFFSLAVAGREGVERMLRLLRTELETAMALCGIERVEDATPDLVTRLPRSSL